MRESSGVVEIRNLKTDKVWLFWADDVEQACSEMRFKLDLGIHQCASLQADYTETGLELFRFRILEYTNDRSRLAYLKKVTDNQYI